MHPEETLLVEEAMHRHREAVAHATNRAEGVRARAEVRNLAQVFERVLLRRDRVGVGVVDEAVDLDRLGLDLNRLTLALACDDGAGHFDRTTRGQLQHFRLVVRDRVWHDRLHGVEAGAVGDRDEGDARLRVAAGADPALDRRGLSEVRFVVLEEVCDANGHGEIQRR